MTPVHQGPILQSGINGGTEDQTEVGNHSCWRFKSKSKFKLAKTRH